MKQSVITQDTHPLLVEKLEAILDRSLTATESAMVEYVLDQVRLGVVEAK